MSPIVLLSLLSQVGGSTMSLAQSELVFIAPQREEGRLHLDAVLLALDRAYPPLLAASQKVNAAQGNLLSAQGNFDIKVKAKGEYDPLGFYDAAKADLMIEQATPLWGLRVFGGYRYGTDFPIYAAKSVTGEAGEARVGLTLPLWRDGPIDAGRLGIRLAELGVDMASLEFEMKRLEAYQKASKAYFKWVAAGLKLQIDRGMLRFAEARQSFVERRVNQGALAAIELLDNRRLVVSRQERVATQEGELARATLNVSLFLRDTEGRVQRPTAESLPDTFPDVHTPSASLMRQAIAQGLDARPELARLKQVKKSLVAQLDFHENQRAPAVDLQVVASKDFGDKASYGPDPAFGTKGETELGLSLSLAWPVQQRKARGKAAATQAKLRQLELERGFLSDAIEVQIRDAYARLLAAQRRTTLAMEAYGLNRQLESAERRKLALGQSTILVINLREEATAKAAKELVDSLTTYHLARADLAVASSQRPR